MADFVLKAYLEGVGSANTGKFGWVETWYFTAADIPTALARADSFATARRRILHKDYGLVEVTASDVTVLRDSLATEYSVIDSPGGFPPPNVTASSAPPSIALLCRAEAGSPRRRAVLLRGIPNNIISGASDYAPTGLFGTAFRAFSRNVLTVPALQLRQRTAGAPVFITAVTVDLTGAALNVTTGVAHGLVANDLVKISGILGLSAPANSVWKVAAVPNATTFSTFSKRKATIVGSYTAGGVVAKLTTTYPAITSLQPERIVKRSTGRPFDLSRGRRRQTT